jgi:hypothetical protein
MNKVEVILAKEDNTWFSDTVELTDFEMSGDYSDLEYAAILKVDLKYNDIEFIRLK